MKNKSSLTGMYILLAEIVIAVFLWCYGFRITYAPELENSWNAISACAAWASVVVSGLAIYYAIQVPKKIAVEQNNIALFEKRYNFYITFCRCISFGEGLGEITTCKEARQLFYIMLSDNAAECDEVSFDPAIATLQIKTVATIGQASFLFPFETDEFLETLLMDIVNVLALKNSQEEFANHCEQLKKSTKIAKEQLTPKFDEVLSAINKL